MSRRILFIAIIALLAAASVQAGTVLFRAGEQLAARSPRLLEKSIALKDAKSGKECPVCTLAVSLLEQYATDNQMKLSDAANAWCADVTVELSGLTIVCDLFIAGFVSKVEADYEAGISPDVSCNKLGYCTNPACQLYPQWPVPPHSDDTPRVGVHEAMTSKKSIHRHYAETIEKLLAFKPLDKVKQLKSADGKVMKLSASTKKTKQHNTRSHHRVHKQKHSQKKQLGGSWMPVPVPDWDQDGYGASVSVRGVQWRGKDCNDGDKTVFPGKNVFASGGSMDASADTNCNGISGVDSASGLPWEQVLCQSTPSRGILAVGDSATAHFSLPPTYVTPSGFNMSTYDNLVLELETEADWPECSWSTAFETNDNCPWSRLNVSSIYQKMYERNRCMHRDYVNAGVNGQSIANLIDDGVITPANYSGNLKAIPARFTTEGPSTVFYSLIGNDICRAHEWGGWTTVEEFTTKALEELAYMDSILYPGSHIIIMGVVDGRVLFDTLQDAWHPAGAKYPQFYDYLNCLQISPCWGWMNTNETVRNASSERAGELNDVWQNIVATSTFKNFDLHFLFPDYRSIINKWVAQGYSALELIEPVDGFHPSQTGNMLLAEAMWEFLQANAPDAMGPENANNDVIVQQFGDQGGYGM